MRKQTCTRFCRPHLTGKSRFYFMVDYTPRATIGRMIPFFKVDRLRAMAKAGRIPI